jgi:3',5'-cyclic-AMP phosphodiesterase
VAVPAAAAAVGTELVALVGPVVEREARGRVASAAMELTPVLELTTVANDEVVFHRGAEVLRYDGLEPDHEYALEGEDLRTLPRPPGARVATIATANDVHFGETECGVLEGFDGGPVLRSGPDEDPYPDTMNRAAVQEIAAADPDLVVVKGDLTALGTRREYEAFLDCWGTAFGRRLVHVRGNHDAYHGETFAADAPVEVELPGVRVAVIDTTIPGHHTGRVGETQLEWLDELGARSDRPVLVFGHHHPWSPTSRTRSDTYFGIHPDDSERLIDVFARRPALGGYFAGHTHRNRVRRFPATGDTPWVEVACVKDYPGAWAEYRVFEGGVLQIHRRISTPAALDWTERTRVMFGGLYPSYAFGRLEDRCFPIWPRS